MTVTDGLQFKSGGWTLHEFSLQNFFLENNLARNSWSQTNCGFDLARYYGTTLNLYPHRFHDYIVFWDTDYTEKGEFEQILSRIHPAVLLGRPNTKVVLSKSTTGRYRRRRIFLPPPAKVQNTWKPIGEWANIKLGLVGIVALDLDDPFLPPNMKMSTPGSGPESWTPGFQINDYLDPETENKAQLTSLNDGHQAITTDMMWWNRGWDPNLDEKTNATKPTSYYTQRDKNFFATAWLHGWPKLKPSNLQDYIKQNHASGTSSTTAMGGWAAVVFGPYVPKRPDLEMQVTWTYRSHWKWGGDIIGVSENVCDPSKPIPKQTRGGRDIADPSGYITLKDLDKAGYIKRDVYARLTRRPPKANRFTNLPREEEEEETEDELQDPYESSESEEEAHSSTHRSRISGRRLDGGRIRELLRLRYYIEHLLKNKRSYSV